jgi:hypothetical protein
LDWKRNSWEYFVPCSRETLAVVLPVAAAPTSRASMTATRRPALASRRAVVSPVIPAPTTISSTGPSGRASSGRAEELSSHREVTDREFPDQSAFMRPANRPTLSC